MVELSKEKRAELEAQHGEIYVHEKSGIVFRCPNKIEMRFFINTSARVAQGKGDLAVACESLARTCAVHPSADEVLAIFEKKPGLPMAVVPHLQALAGLEEDDPKL